MPCPVVIRFAVSLDAQGKLVLEASVRTAMSTLLAVLNMQGIDVDLQFGEAHATFTPTSMRLMS